MLEDGTARIIKYTGKAGVLTLPARLDGYAVTIIGKESFSKYDSLTCVTLPDSVTSIADNAFSKCSDTLTFTVPRYSCAERYCERHKFPYIYAKPEIIDRMRGIFTRH